MALRVAAKVQVQKRFGFPENSVELFAERVELLGARRTTFRAWQEPSQLCHGSATWRRHGWNGWLATRCESLRFKLIGGLAVRRACYGVLRP